MKSDANQTHSRNSHFSERAVRFGVSRGKSVAQEKKKRWNWNAYTSNNKHSFAFAKRIGERKKKVVQAKWQSQRDTKLPNGNEKERKSKNAKEWKKESFRFKEIIHLANSL